MPARKGDGRNDKSAATGQHSAIAADAGAALQWARGADFRNAKLIAGMRSNVSFSISCRRSQCRFLSIFHGLPAAGIAEGAAPKH